MPIRKRDNILFTCKLNYFNSLPLDAQLNLPGDFWSAAFDIASVPGLALSYFSKLLE